MNIEAASEIDPTHGDGARIPTIHSTAAMDDVHAHGKFAPETLFGLNWRKVTAPALWK